MAAKIIETLSILNIDATIDKANIVVGFPSEWSFLPVDSEKGFIALLTGV